MTSDKQLETESKIPERPFGSKFHNDRLSESVSIVGLGCSSFSTFFWNGDENNDGRQTNENESKLDDWSVEGLNRYHPRVQTWIESIVYAIDVAGITLLDTAPWYGHGTSEIVLGWAFRTLSDHKESWRRNRLTINTKVGRYEADPALQFDFSRQATLQSVKRSLQRLSWDEVYSSKTYIDVLQLHDPEFSPTIQLLFEETIPAMLECQENGWCRALGMTGYPLAVQHQILEQSMELFGRNIWDLSLTYGHFNLHDSRFFFNAPYSLSNHDSSVSSCSYATYCQDRSMLLLAAAPLSMGLLTHQGPPEWHPAPIELKQACQEAAALCSEYGIDFACLALLFALCNSQIPCTLLGLSCVDEIKTAHAIALRLKGLSTPNLSHDEMLDAVLNPIERVVLGKLRDTETGPFASVWKLGLFQWDGVQLAHEFWKPLVNQATEKWQAPS